MQGWGQLLEKRELRFGFLSWVCCVIRRRCKDPYPDWTRAVRESLERCIYCLYSGSSVLVGQYWGWGEAVPLSTPYLFHSRLLFVALPSLISSHVLQFKAHGAWYIQAMLTVHRSAAFLLTATGMRNDHLVDSIPRGLKSSRSLTGCLGCYQRAHSAFRSSSTLVDQISPSSPLCHPSPGLPFQKTVRVSLAWYRCLCWLNQSLRFQPWLNPTGSKQGAEQGIFWHRMCYLKCIWAVAITPLLMCSKKSHHFPCP